MGFTLRKKAPDKIIVHCSDSPFGTEKLINEWHLKRWPTGTGYHYIIQNAYPNTSKGKAQSWLDGQIVSGRPLKYTGAHCYGQNSISVGICLIGKKKFTYAQFASLRELCKQLDFYYDKMLDVYPHYYFDKNKTCPNFDVKKALIPLPDVNEYVPKENLYKLSQDFLNLGHHGKIANIHKRLLIVERKVINVP